ncbi:MAG: HIT domain-containing protein [Dehalococcoidales bacterium]|jgi:diadenosine tetraphosphate (Ap4A) HIT family hydrolase
MEDKFSGNLVKDYIYWSVYIHENQGYLGRCVIWCKRANALDLTDVVPAEQQELIIILKDLYQATKRSFQADWFNYAFLGNGVRHLHCHFIPRYQSPRIFRGTAFEDKLWGHNYKTDHTFITSPELLERIRNELKQALG